MILTELSLQRLVRGASIFPELPHWPLPSRSEHLCGEIPKKVSLCPKSQVLGVWLETAPLDPTSFRKQNVPTGEAGSQVQAGTPSFLMEVRSVLGVSFAVK